MKLPDAQTNSESTLLQHIEIPGWEIVATAPDYNGPGYAYSVGLYYNFGHPELVVTGLPVKLAKEIIENIAEMIADGEKFVHEQTTDEVLEDFICGFAAVNQDNFTRYLPLTTWFYAAHPDPVPYLQILWPDKKGILPEHAGVDPKLVDHQPLLTSTRKTPIKKNRW